MKRTVTIILSLTLFVLAAAQTKTPIQKGVIKITNEKGSMAAKGFKIRPSHYKSPIESDNNGSFSIDMKGYKEGQSYRINSVIKIGYDYVNKNETFNNKPFSTSVPLEIFMYNTNIAQDSSLVYQKKLNSRLNKKIENLEKEIKILKQDSDKNKEKIEQLQDSITFLFEKGSVAIKDLADEVAKYGDYVPSHIRKDVYEAIKNGDFEKLEELKKELSNVHTTAKTVAFNRDNIIDSLQAKLLICKSEFNYKEALTCIDDLILLDPNNIDFLFEAGNIAQEYIADYDKALEYYDKALNIALKFGEKNGMVATSYNNIGLVYYCKGEYDKALIYHTKALDIKKQILPKNHPSIAGSYNNIGMVYNNKGKYDKALIYHTKALDIRKQVLTENHPDIAASYNNIGNVYNDKGEYDKALTYLTKALDIQKQVLPKNHSDIANSYYSIGLVYYYKGEYDNALNDLQKALDIQKQILPENHSDIANSYYNIGSIYNNIGSTYSDKGEYYNALTYLTKALDFYKQVFPENHPNMGTSYNNIGLVYHYKGEYDKALTYYTKALDIYKQVLPKNHPDVAASYYSIGNVYFDKGEYDNAVKYLEKSLKIYQTIYSEEDNRIKSLKNFIEDCEQKINEENK